MVAERTVFEKKERSSCKKELNIWCFCLNRFRREKLGEDHQRQKTEEEGVQKFWGPGGVWQRMKSHRSSIIKTETVLGPLEKREGRK